MHCRIGSSLEKKNLRHAGRFGLILLQNKSNEKRLCFTIGKKMILNLFVSRTQSYTRPLFRFRENARAWCRFGCMKHSSRHASWSQVSLKELLYRLYLLHLIPKPSQFRSQNASINRWIRSLDSRRVHATSHQQCLTRHVA
jgi:hypothetical protein